MDLTIPLAGIQTFFVRVLDCVNKYAWTNLCKVPLAGTGHFYIFDTIVLLHVFLYRTIKCTFSFVQDCWAGLAVF